MEKVFVKDWMWTWWINLITYIVVIAFYLFVDGKEMTYAVYLPLDILLNMSKAAYYFLHYYQDFLREKRAEKTA